MSSETQLQPSCDVIPLWLRVAPQQGEVCPHGDEGAQWNPAGLTGLAQLNIAEELGLRGNTIDSYS